MNWLKGIIILLFGLLVGICSSYFIVDHYGSLNWRVCPKSTCKTTDLTKEQIEPMIDISNELVSHNSAILMYHHVKINTQPNNAIERGLDVSPEMFDKQMDMLKRMGFESITMKNMTEDIDSQSTSGRKIAITFDDGYDDIYTEAFPIMKKYGLIGTIYLIVDDIGKSGYMSQSQVNELLEAGFELGSHTLSHPNLANTNEANAKLQIEKSKKLLEKMFNYNVTTICYPSGKFNDQTIDLIKIAGYTSAVTTLEGNVGFKSDIYRLPRLRITGTGKLADFASKIFSI